MSISKKRKNIPVSDENLTSLRELIGLPTEMCIILEAVAVKKRALPAWAVRYSAGQNIGEKRPLLRMLAA